MDGEGRGAEGVALHGRVEKQAAKTSGDVLCQLGRRVDLELQQCQLFLNQSISDQYQI